MVRLLVIVLFVLSAAPAWAQEQDKWEGYIDFLGKPGTARSYGQSDLFVPLHQSKQGMTFFNLRGKTQSFNFDDGNFHIGGGHRQIIGDVIVGANAFYDGFFTGAGKYYNQWGPGIEGLSENWDFRMNAYFPEETEHKINDSAFASDIRQNEGEVRGDIKITRQFEKPLPGLDGEIGYRLPLENVSALLSDTRFYAGGYHYNGENGYEDVNGPRLRIESRIYDVPYLGGGSRIMAGLEFQTDNYQGDQTSGMISIRIPFGGSANKNQPKVNTPERRMVEPVVRHNELIIRERTELEERDAAYLYNPEGLRYTHFKKYSTDKSLEDIIAEVKAITGDGESVVLVEIRANDNNDPLELLDTAIPGAATFALAGRTLKIRYEDNPGFIGFGQASYMVEGENPRQTFSGAKDKMDVIALYLEPRAHINGWDLARPRDSSIDFGIDLSLDSVDPHNYFISNTTFNGFRDYGLLISYRNIVYGDQLVFSSSEHGIEVNGNPKSYAEDDPKLDKTQRDLLYLSNSKFENISFSSILVYNHRGAQLKNVHLDGGGRQNLGLDQNARVTIRDSFIGETDSYPIVIERDSILNSINTEAPWEKRYQDDSSTLNFFDDPSEFEDPFKP